MMRIPGSGPITLPAGSEVFSSPAQFDVSKKAATMEAVQRALGGLRGVASGATSRALTVDDVGCTVFVNPGVALTLPLANSVSAGSVIHFRTSSTGADRTISATGGDTISLGNGGGASIVMKDGDTLSLVAAGTSWVNVSGIAGLGNSAQFGASLSANGYQKLPSGLIVQWGSLSATGSTTTNFSFPIAFPTACVAIASQQIDSRLVCNAPSTTGSSFVNSSATTSVRWIAIGY